MPRYLRELYTWDECQVYLFVLYFHTVSLDGGSICKISIDFCQKSQGILGNCPTFITK